MRDVPSLLSTGAMATRDAKIAQAAVEAIWCSVCQTASKDSKGGTGLLEDLRLALRHCFEQRPKHAGYVRCLQSFALADRGGVVGLGRAGEAAQASGNLQAGALQVGRRCGCTWVRHCVHVCESVRARACV